MTKRGQITIFLIVGIIILVLSATIIYFISSAEKGQISEEQKTPFALEVKPKIVFFVESCLKDKLQEAIQIAGSQGGKIFFDEENTLFTENQFLGYAYKDGDILLKKKQLEEELGLYIDLDLNSCLNNFLSLQETGLEISEEGIKKYDLRFVSEELVNEDIKSWTKVKIYPNLVKADLTYPLIVKQGGSTLHLESFSTAVNSKTDQALNIINDIIGKYQETKLINLDYLAGFEPFIKVFPYDGEKTIYSLYYGEEESPVMFMFAVKDNPNHAPRLNHIPSFFTLTKDQQFTFQVKAYDLDKDKLEYSSDDNDFSITEKGLFSFVPNNVGEFKVTITVEDLKGLKDEQEVKFTVKE
jgi:hypothetical protein